jgi:hypothetical protein
MDGRRETQRERHRIIGQPALLIVREPIEPLLPVVDPCELEVALSRPRHTSAQRQYCQDRREGADCVWTPFSKEPQLWALPPFLCRALLKPILPSERSLSMEQSEVECKVQVMLGSGWVLCTGWWEERTWGHDSGQWKSKVRLIGKTWWHNGSKSQVVPDNVSQLLPPCSPPTFFCLTLEQLQKDSPPSPMPSWVLPSRTHTPGSGSL